MKMFNFKTILIKTDVTALQIYNDFVLSGIGGFLHINNIQSQKLLLRLKVFESIKIYGIQLHPNKPEILFYGQNEVKIYNVHWGDLQFSEKISFQSTDWVLKMRWLDDGVATISMHNVLEYWTDGEQTKQVACEERCILYCAYLDYNSWEDLVVFSGTVFSEVLIWKPSIGYDENVEFCPVLVRLKGHEGVLFSIHHNAGYICSTSDDRSVILWSCTSDNTLKELQQDNPDISMKARMYGHTARVFGCQVLTNNVISIGEDGIVNIWDFNGSLQRRFSAHQGGSIWSLVCDERRNIIVTGGGDSGVTLFPIKTGATGLQLTLGSELVPKKVGVLKNNGLVVATEDGGIYYYAGGDGGFMLVAQFDELRSYVLLEVSKCRSKVAFAGFKGHIFIYSLENKQLKLSTTYQTNMKTRIYALHWITCNTILTCELEGVILLWRQLEDGLLLLHIMELPYMKERWTTSACFCENQIAVGDRKGNIHVYSLNQVKPVQSLKRCHNYLGITNLYYEDNILLSLGRNSTMKQYELNPSKTALQPISSHKLPFTWLSSHLKIKNTTILTSFSSNNFVLWDHTARRILLSIPCGGGHRSWGFNQTRNGFAFAFIKDKFINVVGCGWKSLNPLDIIPSFNSSEINSLICFRRVEGLLFVAGGEDTTIRLSTYDFRSALFENLDILKSHLSSIRCMHLSSGGVLFSAGGRGQIIMWELSGACCKQLYAYYERGSDVMSEVRVMDMCSTEILGCVLLFTACSDGTIKIYCKRPNDIKYISYLQYNLRCILKIAVVKEFLVTMATDGLLVFWNLRDCLVKTSQPFYTLKAQQSGINSFSYKTISDDTFIVMTGGDDNAFSLNLFKVIDENLQHLDSYNNFQTHTAQITGVHLGDKYFISTGLDQNVVVFKYTINNNKIITEYCGNYFTAISDIKGISVFEDVEGFLVVLYGLGVEVLQLNYC